MSFGAFRPFGMFVPFRANPIAAGIAGLFTPAVLFDNNEQGLWYDPSDFSTMFQDSAGTTPVTAVGQPVGRILDKSGRGNHATQATAASRPVLARHPASGLRNLLISSEAFAGPNWAKTAVTVTGDVTSSPTGEITASSVVENTANSLHDVRSTAMNFVAGQTYTVNINVKPLGRTKLQLRLANVQNTDANFDLVALTAVGGANSPIATITALPDNWFNLRMTFVALATGAESFRVSLRDAAGALTYTGDGVSGVYLWGSQTEVGSSASNYQKVTTVDDVTEVGQPNLHYLKFDGVDDFLVTGSINFTATDEMNVFAGLRKLADGLGQCFIEFSASIDSNNGTFDYRVPSALGQPTYLLRSKGTSLASVTPSGFVAPITNVVSLLAKISTDSLIGRVNGAEVASSAADQGTGNYGNYPLYIGRRAGSALPFNGHLYGLIIRGALSTDDRIRQTEEYLGDKTGVEI